MRASLFLMFVFEEKIRFYSLLCDFFAISKLQTIFLLYNLQYYNIDWFYIKIRINFEKAYIILKYSQFYYRIIV